MIQRECETDPLIRSYDYYLFQYDSRLLHQPPLEPFVTGGLDQFLTRIADKYDTVVLIAHSQGGLASKLYILKKLQEGGGNTLKVDLIVTLGTPHNGRRVLAPLLWLQNIPVLRRVLPFWQLAQLAYCSDNIRKLQADWRDAYVCEESIPAEMFRRHIRSIAVVGAYDFWAGSARSEGFAIDIPRYVTAGHPKLAKPESPYQELAEIILDELQRHQHPKNVLEELKTILSDDVELQQYLQQHAQAVANIVKRARPWLQKNGVEQKTASILMDFVAEFPRRPLRNVGFSQALYLYAERQLGEDL